MVQYVAMLTALRCKILVFLSVDTVIQPSFSITVGWLLELRRTGKLADLLLGSDISTDIVHTSWNREI